MRLRLAVGSPVFGTFSLLAHPLLNILPNVTNMIEGLFNQSNYVAAKKMLDATALRHEAIASNLANLETPHYKRVDVEPTFAAELGQAVAAKDVGRLSDLQPQLAHDATAVATRKDGNTVQLETELLKLNQNFMEHQLETQLISSAMLKLRLAITGRSV